MAIKPTIIPRDQHIISRSNISDNALTVLRRLKKAGYEAYLVGGGVRDLLLGREPKDFDVATDASPEQVKQTFNNCRLIGRRFRLAHIHFGREIIEVATFRGNHSDQGEEISRQSDEGMLLRDNVFGTIEEDAIRRDFTVNALFYNIRDFTIVDYVDGVKDIEAGHLRLIGDPETRYREDPVRMLRAARFAAKLGFTIDTETAEPIPGLAYLLEDVSSSRLFEEVLKLFLGGSAVHTFEKLRQYGLFAQLFPQTEKALEFEDHDFPIQFVMKGLINTDKRIREGKPVTPAFLFAVFLWESVRNLFNEKLQIQKVAQTAMFDAADQVLARQLPIISIPRRFTGQMKEIWNMQLRLEKSRSNNRAKKLIEHPRFRAAYDFLLLRAESGEVEQEQADWWTSFQDNPDIELPKKSGRRGYRNRKRKPKQKPS